MRLRPRNRVEIFGRFLLSHLLLLLMPIVVGSLAYKGAVKVVEEDAKHINLAILEQARDSIDRQMAEIHSLLTKIDQNPEVRNLLRSDKDIVRKYPYRIWKTWKSIQSYGIENDTIAELYLYFKNADVILSQDAAYMYPDRFYGWIFQYMNMSCSEWQKMMFYKYYHKTILPSVDVSIKGKNQSLIPYLQSIPMSIPSKHYGVAMVLIDKEKINGLLKSLYIDEGGWAYIANDQNEIITVINEDENKDIPIFSDFKGEKGFVEQVISNEKMTISYAVSPKNGWTYVAAVPTRVVMAKVDYIKQLTLNVAMVILLIGLLIAVFMSYFNAQPIRNLIKTIRDKIGYNDVPNHNAYDFLHNTFTELIDNNKALKSSLEKQRPYLKAAFFDRLFKGELHTINEINNLLQYIGIQMKGACFVVMLARVGNYGGNPTSEILNELNVKRMIAKEIMSRFINNMGFIQEINEDMLALLFSFPKNNWHENKCFIENLIKNTKEALQNQYDFSMSFGLGRTYDSLLDINRSFNEAKQALDYKDGRNKEAVIWFGDIPKESNRYYYTVDLELRIMNLTKAGETKEVQKLLNEVYIDNFVRKKLPLYMQKELICELRGTLIKTLELVADNGSCIYEEIERKVYSLCEMNDTSEVFESIVELFTVMCEHINENKRSHNYELKEKLINYINSCYTNPEISLCGVADQFGLTEVYLSKFFKEQIGENFSIYLERIRLTEAQKLLVYTELSIDEIANQVGYNSTHVFRRAFKRNYGVTPSVYRDSAQVTMENI